MKVVIRPKGTIDLFEKGIAKVWTETSDGRKEEVGSYKQSLLPGNNKTIRVFWDENIRVYDIDISEEELQDAVDEFKLVDPKTGELIEHADKRNEHDPFFSSVDLELAIPNSGKVLDNETGIGNFWIKAAYSDERRFEVEGSGSNPLYQKVQEFKVTTAGYKEKKQKETLSEGKRAAKLFSKISDDYEMMLAVAKGFSIEFDKNNNPSISDLEDILYAKITLEKDRKDKFGRRNIDIFLDLASAKKSKIRLIAILSDAITFDIITRDGRMYSYEEEELGLDLDYVYEYVIQDKNAEIQANIIRDVAKITGKVKSDNTVNLLDKEEGDVVEDKKTKSKGKASTKAKSKKEEEKTNDSDTKGEDDFKYDDF